MNPTELLYKVDQRLQQRGALHLACWVKSRASCARPQTSKKGKSSLVQIVTANDSASDIQITDLQDLSKRPRRHLDDAIHLGSLLESSTCYSATRREGLRECAGFSNISEECRNRVSR